MPNYCENELQVRGPKEDVQRFMKKARLGEEAISISSFYPIPESLEKSEAGGQEAYYRILHEGIVDDYLKEHMRKDGFENPTKEKALEWQAKCWKKTVKEATEIANQYKHNMETYGHTTWYTWCIQNWGTKWDVKESSLVSSEEILIRNKKVWEINYAFLSAWSPPREAFFTISKDYPTLQFVLKFWESGMEFKGVFECKDGKVFSNKQEQYSGSRGG